MANDPRYNQLTAESLPLETRNLKDFFESNKPSPDGRKLNNPWKMAKPSKRVANCPTTMWIYNVSPRRHAISSLPGMSKVLPECPVGSDGKRIAPYGHPLPIKEITLDYASRGDYKLDAIEVDDIDLASNIVCPSCQGQGTNCKDTADLRIWGVFYSTHNPAEPVDAAFEAELALANQRLNKTCSNLIKIADNMYENPKNRWQVEGKYGEVYAMAAKHMSIKRPWCTPLADMDNCPGCGQTNPKAAMVCSQPTCGIILDYDKALKYGKITQEQFNAAVSRGVAKFPEVAQ
jgi:hypothetical protein